MHWVHTCSFILFLQSQSPKLETAHPAPTVPVTITHQTAQKNLSQSNSGESVVAPAPSQQNSTVGNSVTASSSSDDEASSPAVTAVPVITTTQTGKEADIYSSRCHSVTCPYSDHPFPAHPFIMSCLHLLIMNQYIM